MAMQYISNYMQAKLIGIEVYSTIIEITETNWHGIHIHLHRNFFYLP